MHVTEAPRSLHHHFADDIRNGALHTRSTERFHAEVVCACRQLIEHVAIQAWILDTHTLVQCCARGSVDDRKAGKIKQSRAVAILRRRRPRERDRIAGRSFGNSDRESGQRGGRLSIARADHDVCERACGLWRA
jgi:hypothetical protein